MTVLRPTYYLYSIWGSAKTLGIAEYSNIVLYGVVHRDEFSTPIWETDTDTGNK